LSYIDPRFVEVYLTGNGLSCAEMKLLIIVLITVILNCERLDETAPRSGNDPNRSQITKGSPWRELKRRFWSRTAVLRPSPSLTAGVNGGSCPPVLFVLETASVTYVAPPGIAQTNPCVRARRSVLVREFRSLSTMDRSDLLHVELLLRARWQLPRVWTAARSGTNSIRLHSSTPNREQADDRATEVIKPGSTMP
jgi:hypothetical protein